MGKRRVPRFGLNTLRTIDRSNEVFEEYYKNQLGLDDADFQEFMSSLRQDLPVTFRITGFRQQSKELLSLLQENYLHSLISKADSTNTDYSIKSLEWYPEEMAWEIDASRATIRKLDELKALQNFLVSESESGNISRQEAVSMLPPLLLDVKEHHAVLDLCAAPGSKSAQLVELLHADAEKKYDNSSGYAEPSGLVIANDLDRKRCYMMIHQVKRLQSPCVLLTEEDAAIFPRIFVDSPTNPNEMTQLLFDRILADVPCSGDGTLRKSPDIWRRWTPKMGRGQHDLQKRILRRGLELLRVPAPDETTDLPRLVYSTCSLNPVEDEAVVASILNAAGGAVRLVEPELICLKGQVGRSGFVARPGLRSWRVLLGSNKWISTHEEVPPNDKGTMQPSLFTPPNADELHLEYCRRVLPHDQNTGGFFVAVLEKVAELPWMRSKTRTVKKEAVSAPLGEDQQMKPTEATGTGAVGEKVEKAEEPKQKRARVVREESGFVYFDPTTDKDWPQIRDYYGIRDETVQEKETVTSRLLRADQLLYRPCGEILRRRNIYYTNRMVKRIIEANVNKGLHIVSGGVKLFAVCEDKQFNGYRLLHDGAHLADAFLPRFSNPLHPYPPQACFRRISLTSLEHGDLLTLLREEMPLVEKMSSTTRSQWAELSVGPVLIEYDPAATIVGVPGTTVEPSETAALLPRCKLAFAGWRGIKSLRHYVDRHERVHLLRLCGLDPSIPMLMGKQQQPSETEPADLEKDSPSFLEPAGDRSPSNCEHCPDNSPS
ncbi:tRNA (cytosine(34)-C(5))-methyltransferase [Sparganum proliferum]